MYSTQKPSDHSIAFRVFTTVLIIAATVLTAVLLSNYIASKHSNANARNSILLAPILSYKDQSKSVDIDEALALQRAGAFDLALASSERAAFENSSLWFYTRFMNQKPISVELILDTDLHVVPSGEIYTVRDGQVTPVLVEDATTFASLRPVLPRRFAVPMRADPGETVEIFLRYEPRIYHDLNLTLMSLADLMKLELNKRDKHFLLFGFCAALAIAGLAISIVLRLVPAAFYSGFVLSLMLIAFVSAGYVNEYLPGWNNAIHYYAFRLFICSACSFGAMFLSALFKFKDVAPFLNWLVQLWIFLSCCIALSTLWITHPQLDALSYIFMAISGPVYFGIACVGIYYGWPGARLLLVGSCMLGFVGFSVALGDARVPWVNTEAIDEVYLMGTVIEAVAFLLIIVLRISEIRRTEEIATSRSLKLMRSEIELIEALREAELLAKRRQEIVANKARLAASQIDALKSELEHTGRVNLMGQFAAGLAHELNQPLCATAHDLDTAKLMIKDTNANSDRLKDILDNIEKHTLRAGEIIRALRRMVQKRKQSKDSFDLRNLIDQTVSIVQGAASANKIAIDVRIRDGLFVFADRSQIAQVMVNLLQNAIEALGQSATGDKRISISSRVTTESVQISVQDSGPGIPVGLQPFADFESGTEDGMGLGLSICKSLVLVNDGQITVDDTCTEGTRFEITLKKG